MTSGEAVRAGFGALQSVRRAAIDRAASFVLGLRGRHLFLIDLAAVVASIYLALQTRDDGFVGVDVLAATMPTVILPLLIRPIANERFGLYRRLWGNASVPELGQIVW